MAMLDRLMASMSPPAALRRAVSLTEQGNVKQAFPLLARAAREITALEVIRTIDGPIFLTACFTEHGYCCHTDKCIVRDPLQKVHEGILRLLASITIADMSLDSAPADGNMNKAPERLYGRLHGVYARLNARKG